MFLVFQTSSPVLMSCYRQKSDYGVILELKTHLMPVCSSFICIGSDLWRLTLHSNRACDSRKYTYYFPSYLLIPPKPGNNLNRVLSQLAEASGHSAAALSHQFWDDHQSSREVDMQRKRTWRVHQDQIEKLRGATQKFVGTHNFHNFTVGRDASDKSNMRHMKSIEVSH